MAQLVEIGPCDSDRVNQLLGSTARQRPSVILLYARHCPPCEQLHPQVEQVARNTPEVDFYALAAEGQRHLCKQLGIIGFPAQVFIDRNGNRSVVMGTDWRHINKALDKLLEEHV
jgi:thiol-disulfide isomerase/thioredoxin